MSNCRPITLITNLVKILENSKNTIGHVQKYKLLSENQFGLRNGRSTEEVMNLLTSTYTKLDKKQINC